MQRFILSSLVTTFAWCFAPAASATPVVNSTLRLVATSDPTITYYGASSPDFAVGSLSDSVNHLMGRNLPGVATPQLATANQTSLIDPAAGLIKGKGHAGLGFSVLEDDQVFVESDMVLSFTLTKDHSYSLFGLLSASSDGGVAEGLFDLSGPDSLSFVTHNGTLALGTSGILHAGDYVLRIDAEMTPNFPSRHGFMGGDAGFDVTFSLADIPKETPEPATWMLLAGSVAGLAVTRRRDAKGRPIPE